MPRIVIAVWHCRIPGARLPSPIVFIAALLLAGTQNVLATRTMAAAFAASEQDVHYDSSTFQDSAVAAFREGSASSNVDVSSGAIRVFARGTGITDASTPPESSSAFGELDETLTILGEVDGTLSGSVVFHLSGGLVPAENEEPGFLPTAGSSSHFMVFYDNNSSLSNFSYHTVTQGCGIVTDPNTPTSLCEHSLSTHKTFELPFTFTDSARVIDIQMQVSVFAFQNGMSDFSNTAFVTLSLPEGNTFSSASGVFLTTAVPEPSSLALSGLGIVCVSGIAWARRSGTRRNQPTSPV